MKLLICAALLVVAYGATLIHTPLVTNPVFLEDPKRHYILISTDSGCYGFHLDPAAIEDTHDPALLKLLQEDFLRQLTTVKLHFTEVAHHIINLEPLDIQGACAHKRIFLVERHDIPVKPKPAN